MQSYDFEEYLDNVFSVIVDEEDEDDDEDDWENEEDDWNEDDYEDDLDDNEDIVTGKQKQKHKMDY